MQHFVQESPDTDCPSKRTTSDFVRRRKSIRSNISNIRTRGLLSRQSKTAPTKNASLISQITLHYQLVRISCINPISFHRLSPRSPHPNRTTLPRRRPLRRQQVLPFWHDDHLRRKQTAPLRLRHRRLATRSHNTPSCSTSASSQTTIRTPNKWCRRIGSRRRVHGIVQKGNFGVRLAVLDCQCFEGALLPAAAE